MISRLQVFAMCFLMVLPINLPFPAFFSNTAFSICRKAIEHYLTTGERIQFSNLPEIFNERIPVYVSLRKGNQTRGCAGTFFPNKTLLENLIDFSIIAATKDFRYRPIDNKELETIRIQITIPGQIVEIPSLFFYNPDKEGLIVEKQDRCGIVLPGEARTAEYALKICLRNAGIEYSDGIRLLKFSAQTFIEGEK